MNIILKTLKDAKEQVASYGETIIDLAVDNETWENVPIVDHAVKVLKINDVYKKNRIKRNYEKFIKAIEGLDQEQITKFAEETFNNKTELSIEASETIFEIIVESQKPIKAEILGNLTYFLAKGNIRLEDYNNLLLIVQNASVTALRALPKFLESNGGKTSKLANGGVAEEPLLLSLGVAKRLRDTFQLDKTGQQLAKFGFRVEAVFT